MYCKRCGHVIPDSAAVCPSCGSMASGGAPGGERAVSTGNWFLTLFLVGIPLVGLVLLLAWAFSGSTNSSKQNWARAALIWAVIVIMLAAAFGGGGAALVAGRLSRLA